MTREEAIAVLRREIEPSVYEDEKSIAEAIDMAISALSKVDNAENPKCDLISRADVVNEIQRYERHFNTKLESLYVLINELPSAELPKGDLISRADAIEAVESNKSDWNNDYNRPIEKDIQTLKALPSADAVQGWRIGKPTEQGKYMVTLDSFGHKHIDLFYYGKPLMPNRKVRGKCWYRSDDEWGDVVYDDTDILAWMPLPKPYKGGA